MSMNKLIIIIIIGKYKTDNYVECIKTLKKRPENIQVCLWGLLHLHHSRLCIYFIADQTMAENLCH